MSGAITVSLETIDEIVEKYFQKEMVKIKLEKKNEDFTVKENQIDKMFDDLTERWDEEIFWIYFTRTYDFGEDDFSGKLILKMIVRTKEHMTLRYYDFKYLEIENVEKVFNQYVRFILDEKLDDYRTYEKCEN